jgi:hypothetical protein
MELLEGQTLRHMIAGRPLEIETVLDLSIHLRDGARSGKDSGLRFGGLARPIMLLGPTFVLHQVFAAMSKVVSLREIISALEAASDDRSSYLDPETGEIIVVTEEERALAEDKCWEEAPAWQREMMPKIRAALEGDRWLELPDRFDIREWSIMERFSRAQNIEGIRSELLSAIHGTGAFRTFRSAIRRLGLEQSWYQFRDEALADVVRSWLEEHKLQYTQ